MMERECDGNGTRMERGWNGNGTGMGRGWNGDGTVMEREWNGNTKRDAISLTFEGPMSCHLTSVAMSAVLAASLLRASKADASPSNLKLL